MSPRIPSLLHQTWRDRDVPSPWRSFQRGWRERHPGWTHRLWTDADLRALVRDDYPWLLETFDGYREPIRRADAGRYLVLHRHGGLYVDLDFECLLPVDALLAGRELVMGLEPTVHLEIPALRDHGLERIACNAFIASIPGHPFWEHLFRQLLRAPNARSTLDATGPFLVTRAVESWSEKDRITLLPAELIYPASKFDAWSGRLGNAAWRGRLQGAYAVHHWAGSWLPALGGELAPCAAASRPAAPPGRGMSRRRPPRTVDSPTKV